MGLRKTGFDGRAGKNFDRFIFAFFNNIDPQLPPLRMVDAAALGGKAATPTNVRRDSF
jgi:hypothetical protein